MVKKFFKTLGLTALLSLGGLFSSCDNNTGLNFPEFEVENGPFFVEIKSSDGCTLSVDDAFSYSPDNGIFVVDNISNGTHDFSLKCDNVKEDFSLDVELLNNYSYVEGTAVDYWNSIGGSSSVDVSVFDTNFDKGFTNFEKEALDFYKQLLNDGFTSSEIQSFIDYFPTVGKITLFSLKKSYESYKYFSQFNTSLVFTPKVVGWIDLDGISNVKNELGDNYLYPPLFADPNISGLSRLNSYPINRFSTNPGLEDLLPESSRMETCFSKFYGFTDLEYAGENTKNTSSLDVTFDRNKILSLPSTPTYNNIAPEDGIVTFVSTSTMHNSWDDYDYTDAGLSLKFYILPADRKIFDSPDHFVKIAYNHISLEGKKTFDISELPFKKGDKIHHGDVMGVIQHNEGNSIIILDLVVKVYGVSPELETVTPTITEELNINGKTKTIKYNILDPTCGVVYPDHFKANTTNIAYNQDLSSYAPWQLFDYTIGNVVYKNIPNGYVY